MKITKEEQSQTVDLEGDVLFKRITDLDKLYDAGLLNEEGNKEYRTLIHKALF